MTTLELVMLALMSATVSGTVAYCWYHYINQPTAPDNRPGVDPLLKPVRSRRYSASSLSDETRRTEIAMLRRQPRPTVWLRAAATVLVGGWARIAGCQGSFGTPRVTGPLAKAFMQRHRGGAAEIAYTRFSSTRMAFEDISNAGKMS